MEAIIPSSIPHAVITPTGFGPRIQTAEVGSPEWSAVSKEIPFFGLLNGLVYVGHSVWLFDGRVSELEAGCREADVLIVNSKIVGRLTAASLELRARRCVLRTL